MSIITQEMVEEDVVDKKTTGVDGSIVEEKITRTKKTTRSLSVQPPDLNGNTVLQGVLHWVYSLASGSTSEATDAALRR